MQDAHVAQQFYRRSLSLGKALKKRWMLCCVGAPSGRYTGWLCLVIGDYLIKGLSVNSLSCQYTLKSKSDHYGICLMAILYYL